MGFVMLGAFAFNEIALQGVVMQMITHGISTGALFILSGALYERVHTRDISKMGGFWPQMPGMGAVAMVFVMASLGLPGLGNFIAEFLTLVGAWQATHILTIFAAIGLVGATAYSLRIMQRVFYGASLAGSHPLPDLTLRERLILIPLVVAIIWLGLFPQPMLNTSRLSIKTVLEERSTASKQIIVPAKITEGGAYDPE
jgi:NADH-quinone oxidoreductase subunit M